MGSNRAKENPPYLTPEAFAAEANVSRETLDRLRAFADLLAKWQKSINLVSKADLPDLWRRHILDSAQLLPLMPPAPTGRDRVIADLGSGGGFPGLVLAIMGAGQVHLFESNSRKCTFLAEAARITGASATIHGMRLEAIGGLGGIIRADVVTARGLAPLPQLLEYAAPMLVPGSVCLFLKGAGVKDELTAAGKVWNMRVETLPSRTSGSGVILRLGEIARDGAKSARP